MYIIFHFQYFFGLENFLKAKAKKYAGDVLENLRLRKLSPDLILVDGRSINGTRHAIQFDSSPSRVGDFANYLAKIELKSSPLHFQFLSILQ